MDMLLTLVVFLQVTYYLHFAFQPHLDFSFSSSHHNLLGRLLCLGTKSLLLRILVISTPQPGTLKQSVKKQHIYKQVLPYYVL